jgi:hypothetical protein
VVGFWPHELMDLRPSNGTLCFQKSGASGPTHIVLTFCFSRQPRDVPPAIVAIRTVATRENQTKTETISGRGSASPLKPQQQQQQEKAITASPAKKRRQCANLSGKLSRRHLPPRVLHTHPELSFLTSQSPIKWELTTLQSVNPSLDQ